MRMFGMAMKTIPESIQDARLINSDTREEIALSRRSDSCCHFADRIPHANYEVALRIDWSDMDVTGDPTLDADFFSSGDTKPLKDRQFRKAHHTHKALKDGIGTYDFSFEGPSIAALATAYSAARHQRLCADCFARRDSSGREER